MSSGVFRAMKVHSIKNPPMTSPWSSKAPCTFTPWRPIRFSPQKEVSSATTAEEPRLAATPLDGNETCYFRDLNKNTLILSFPEITPDKIDAVLTLCDNDLLEAINMLKLRRRAMQMAQIPQPSLPQPSPVLPIPQLQQYLQMQPPTSQPSQFQHNLQMPRTSQPTQISQMQQYPQVPPSQPTQRLQMLQYPQMPPIFNSSPMPQSQHFSQLLPPAQASQMQQTSQLSQILQRPSHTSNAYSSIYQSNIHSQESPNVRLVPTRYSDVQIVEPTNTPYEQGKILMVNRNVTENLETRQTMMATPAQFSILDNPTPDNFMIPRYDFLPPFHSMEPSFAAGTAGHSMMSSNDEDRMKVLTITKCQQIQQSVLVHSNNTLQKALTYPYPGKRFN